MLPPWGRDISKGLPSLFLCSDYYPLPIVQVGSNEDTERSLRANKRDFGGLWQLVDRVQVVFSSISSVAARETERTRKTHHVNT